MITVASVFFAIFLALIMRSMQIGSYDMMEHDAVKNSTGYIQIHADGYWDDKTINNTFKSNEELLKKVRNNPNITTLTPRLESFALASSGNMTKGIGVIGTDPEIENEMTGLGKRIIRGSYFSGDSAEILLGVTLAKFLKVDIGDTLVLLSQGFHGITAAGEFLVTGILEFPAKNMNSEIAYLKLKDAQYFYAAPERLTSLSIMIEEPDDLEATTEALRQKLGNKYEVMTWKQMMVALVQSIQSDNISGIFMLGILYLVVAFGIFGTMLMMTMERRKEFAVMVSVGMQRYKIVYIIVFETLFIGLMGIALGIIISLPIIYYLHLNPIPLTGAAAQAMIDFNARPILPFSTDLFIFTNQAIVVIILTFLAIVYPIYYVSKFNILKAFHGR